MENGTLLLNRTPNNMGCISYTKSVYLYGYLIPAIALCIFGITFNPMALYYFTKSRNFRRTAYSSYFSTIAVVDLIRLIVWFLFFLLDFKILKLSFRSFECSVQIFSESVTSSISAWLTVSLAVERCLVIYRPFQTRTDKRGKRAMIIIICVILASCFANSLFFLPGFFIDRHFRNESYVIVCIYNPPSMANGTTYKLDSYLNAKTKRIYMLIIVILRVVVPFVLLLATNVMLFVSVRKKQNQSSKDNSPVLVRHGDLGRVTPMIFFSSCILLLTISPRYLYQFYMNFLKSKMCPVVYLLPHILKMIELINYSFNVFISIVSGKHGRNELFKLILCRSVQLPTGHYNMASRRYDILFLRSSISIKCRNRQKLNIKTDETNNPTTKPLLSNVNHD